MSANWITRLKEAFSARPEENPDITAETAVAALLLEAAGADDHVDDHEMAVAERAVARVFGLKADEAKTIVARAAQAREDAADIVRFTRAAKIAFAPTDRVALIEAVWEVVLADDEVTPDEDAYVRRLAGLIYVSDIERGAARKRAAARAQA